MKVSVVIESDGIDLQELDALTRSLEQELALLDAADSVQRPEVESLPEGAKSGTVVTIGTLIVSGVFSRAALQALVGLVGEWRKRAEARRVELTEGDDSLIVEALSPGEQRALIEAWIERRSTER
ncbi:hypothetical protein [Streptomyces sp. NPDC047108]|uniref:hypothetical protein n=1 Tax=Streptomyces sp. NPDC047108 TaxID=3155025 RepID=UPI0033D3AF2A